MLWVTKRSRSVSASFLARLSENEDMWYVCGFPTKLRGRREEGWRAALLQN